MNELSIEQKAKAYDEAIKKARKELQICGSLNCDAARQIYRLFPELKESEDEKIREELMDFIYVTCFPVKDLKKKERFLTWLEKQGEQKSTEWSNEDDCIVESILFWLKSVLNKGSYPRYEHWLNSIKQRIRMKYEEVI